MEIIHLLRSPEGKIPLKKTESEPPPVEYNPESQPGTMTLNQECKRGHKEDEIPPLEERIYDTEEHDNHTGLNNDSKVQDNSRDPTLHRKRGKCLIFL